MKPKIVSYKTAKRLSQTGLKGKADFYWGDNLEEIKLICAFGKKDIHTRWLESFYSWGYPAYSMEELLYTVQRKYEINPHLKDDALIPKLHWFFVSWGEDDIEKSPFSIEIVARHLLIAIHKKMLIKT